MPEVGIWGLSRFYCCIRSSDASSSSRQFAFASIVLSIFSLLLTFSCILSSSSIFGLSPYLRFAITVLLPHPFDLLIISTALRVWSRAEYHTSSSLSLKVPFRLNYRAGSHITLTYLERWSRKQQDRGRKGETSSAGMVYCFFTLTVNLTSMSHSLTLSCYIRKPRRAPFADYSIGLQCEISQDSVG